MSYSTYKKLGSKPEDTNDYQMMDKLVPKLKSLVEKKNVVSMNKLVVVDIYADWCQPCKLVAPRVAELSHKYTNPGMCVIVKENLDDEISDKNEITGVPTFQFYFKGRLVHSVVGADMEQVERNIGELLLK